jgi:hypothetical protein
MLPTRCSSVLASALVLTLVWSAPAQEPAGHASEVQIGSMRFRVHTIAEGLRNGYQMVAVDLTGNGRKDLITLAESGEELFWFENPGWQRHVMATGVPRMISVAAHDIDGDGVPEVALAYRFSGRPTPEQPGILALLRQQGDVRQPWSITEIDRVPTSHRLRWIDVDGSGEKVLLNGPMVSPEAEELSIANAVPVYLYRPGAWRRETLTRAPHGYLHGLTVVDWYGDGPRDLLTASSLGIHAWRRGSDGEWSGRLLTPGNDEPFPRSGTADVVVGRTEAGRFMAAIEPYHGNLVAIYTDRDGVWARQVIERELQTGHAIAAGDFSGNGRDEVVVGFRGKGHQLYVFAAEDAEARHWTRHVLDDGGIAAAACVAEDIVGDPGLDIACMGSGTGNVKVYENITRAGARTSR